VLLEILFFWDVTRVFGQMVLDISKKPFATFFRVNTPKKDLPNDTE
jgi:hypothetical protein